MKDANSDQDLPPDWTESFDQAVNELHSKISLGLLGKRETESLQDFEDRAVEFFRKKGLFKGEQA